jgi:ABC-type lipoprotein release transport system permease subunit
VALRGLEVARDSTVSLIGDKVADGSWLDPADPYGVVIGRRLARTVDVRPGDELMVLTQGADGSIANELYTVRGVLLGIAEGTDRSTVFMNDTTFRELMVFPTGAHQIIVRRPADVELEAAAAEVRSLAPQLTVKTWAELMPVIAAMLDSTQAMTAIIFFIVYIAVAILILNAMLMAVFERIKEFGVLKALGVGPIQVMSLILVECAIQAAFAIVIGLSLAVPGMWYLSEVGIDVGALAGTDVMGIATRPVWYGTFTTGNVSLPVVMLVVIVFCAALYPAFKAALIQPVSAMRHR